MAKLKQDYCKKSEFRDELWTKVSSECSDSQWFYSVNERRLFIVTVMVFTVAGIFLYMDVSMNRFETTSMVEKLDKVNSQKLEKLRDVTVSVSPTQVITAVNNE